MNATTSTPWEQTDRQTDSEYHNLISACADKGRMEVLNLVIELRIPIQSNQHNDTHINISTQWKWVTVEHPNREHIGTRLVVSGYKCTKKEGTTVNSVLLMEVCPLLECPLLEDPLCIEAVNSSTTIQQLLVFAKHWTCFHVTLQRQISC